MYELAIYGVTDNEFCGIGENTVLLGFELPCDMDWRQIALACGTGWFFGTVFFFPIAFLIVILREYFSKHE